MCGVAEAGIAMSVLSAVVGAVGAQQQGKAAQAEADYRAAIDRNNAIRAGYAADDAIARGKEAEKQERLRGRLLVGRMRASLAGSGQVIDEGSAGNLVIDQAGTNEQNALNVRANAAREAYGYRSQAANFESSASLSTLSGRNARSAGNLAAAGTLLSGAGKVATKWYEFDEAGAFD